MKHHPFSSDYKPDFYVVEEKQGNRRLYPATEQLPILLRALRHEFNLFLPKKVAYADARASDFVKIQRKMAVDFFCHFVNKSRTDDLKLFGLLDRDRVAQVAIVQQITDSTPLGSVHRFRFYAGEGVFPEIFLSRRRLLFSSHALDRFSERVPKLLEGNFKTFLVTFFSTYYVMMRCGDSDALVLKFMDSLLALPIEQQDDGMLIKTCLTIDEINSLEMVLPPFGLNLHYDSDFKYPRIRNWSPTVAAAELRERWEKKDKLPEPNQNGKDPSWSYIAASIKDLAEKQGHGSGSRMVFLDNIPGPFSIDLKPVQAEFVCDELTSYNQTGGVDVDWDSVFGERAEQINSHKCPP